MVVTRKGFAGIVANGFASLGFSAEAPTVYEFPVEMFLVGADLTPINENIDKIVYGLTKWEPEVKEKGVITPPMVTVAGEDYQEAVTNMNNLFLKNMWSDGLPLFPATEERVNWILTGTDLPRDEVIGKILPRGGIAPVESLAVALAMAGGRPEYMPLLIAAVEAIVDPLTQHQGMQATTNSCYPAVMVNGPIAKQIRLNSGYGCMGPDPKYPAGASIGHAIRLILLDMGGSIPGVGSMAIHGGPARYTNVIFAEDEDGIPPGWEPLSVDLGFPKGSNVATVYVVAGTTNMCGGAPGTEEEALADVNNYITFMTTVRCNYWGVDTYNASPGILVLGRETARGIVDSLGWSKKELQTYLWENSKLPWSLIEWAQTDFRTQNDLDDNPVLVENEPWPITSKPENFTIVVAGGEQSGHGYWMRTAWPSKALVSRELQLPANWDELIEQAEAALGPIAAA